MATTTDTGFDLLPADPAELSADDLLDAALATEVVGEDPDEPAPFGRGWAFDFLKNEFVRHGAAPAEARGVDELRVWIQKVLHTARYAHSIYSDEFGIELPDDLIGSPFSSRMAGLVAAAITDALSTHDRITAVDGFSFEGGLESDVLYVDFTVTIDDTEPLPFASVPIASALLHG